MYIGVGIVIYIACLTDMVPNQFKKLLKEPIVKMIVLSTIAYLSTINFEGALMLTIVYFATANCMSYENFSNLLVEDTTTNTSSIKSMKDAIKNYSDNRTINEINRENLKRWGNPATDSLPAGQCYKGTASSVIDNGLDQGMNIASSMLNRFTGRNSSGETPTVTTDTSSTSRCGDDDLNDVVKCAKDTGTDPFNNQQNTFPACGAAYGKYLKRVCIAEGDNGNCVDSSGTVVCSGGPANCNDDDLKDHTKFELRSLTATDNTNLDEMTVENIRNRYLKDLDDPTGTIDPNSDEVPTTLKKKIVLGEEVQLHNVGSLLLEQIRKLNDPTLNTINESGDKPKYKLNGGYVYLYKLANKTVPTEDQLTAGDKDTKILPEDYIEIYISEISKLTDENTHVELEIAINDKNKYFTLDVNGNFSYDFRRNPEFGGTAGNTNEYLDSNNNQTNEEDKAANAHHPNFATPAYNYEKQIAKYDIFDRQTTEVITKNADIDSFKAKYDAVYSGTSKPTTTDIEALQTALTGDQADSGFLNNLKGDLTSLTEWKTKKKDWEDATAKKIMRSIGCHRLRDPNTDLYGYWDSAGNKCEYELLPTQ